MHPPTEWNTTVVAERRCARKGNMFQEAVRLDWKTGGFAFDGGLTKQREERDAMCQKVNCEKRKTYALSTAWGRFRAASEGVRGYLVYRECISKKRYNDEYSARKAAKRIAFIRDTPLRVYHCRFCNGYHLTSKCVTPDCHALNDVA